MSDSEFYERVRRVMAKKEILRDQEIGAVEPDWTLSIDPQTGILMVSFRPGLLARKSEIHHLASAIEMHMQNYAAEVRGAP